MYKNFEQIPYGKSNFQPRVMKDFRKEGISPYNPEINNEGVNEQNFQKVYVDGKLYYKSEDARLKHPMRQNEPLLLKRPPAQTLPDQSLKRDPHNFRGFGNFVYYKNNQLSEPYNQQVFSSKAKVMSYIYKDPMDGVHRRHDRQIIQDDNDDSLQWIKDSNRHRDEILASKMRKHIGRTYEPSIF